MDGLLVVNISLLYLLLLLDCLLLHFSQSHDHMHQFVYEDGMVVIFVAGVMVVTERLLGWGHLGWGNLVVVERKHMVGIVSLGVVTVAIMLGWVV